MKKFKVNNAGKCYVVNAKNIDSAIKAMKTLKANDIGAHVIDSNINDAASSDDIIYQLIADEESATKAYDNAIENLQNVLDSKAIQALEMIRDEELKHSETLYAILHGDITDKNLQDSYFVNEMSPDTALDKVHIKYDGYDEPRRGSHYFEFDNKFDAEKAQRYLSSGGYSTSNVITKKNGAVTYYVLNVKE